jgi:hypothetical protein
MTGYDEEILEETGEKPNLTLICNELQQASTDSGTYRDRMGQAYDWWQSEWDGMSFDGRTWTKCGNTGFPYEGAWDSRLRTCASIVADHVTIGKTAFWNAKIQARSSRPLIYGRQRNVMQKVLDYEIYTQMKAELNREIPMLMNWRFAYGASLSSVMWEQRRNKEEMPISLALLGQLAQMTGSMQILEMLLDTRKERDKELVKFFQSLSPIMDTDEARTIIQELRTTGQSAIPVAQLVVNKPRWLARRFMIDVIIPSETSDIQTARFINDRELVNEVELEDRITTDGYDPDFVNEAVQHKGEFASWYPQVGLYSPASDSNRDLIELNHFYYRTIHKGTPCVYRTVFNEAVSNNYKTKDLAASHGPFSYKHRQYPFVVFRRSYADRPILSSVGIPHESYTDEQNMKVQQDGLCNRTDLIHRPPMIVPPSRKEAVRSEFGPGATMTVSRPNEIGWMPLPPMDQTPVAVMTFIQSRLNDRYKIQGADVDPEIKSMRRQEIANDVLGEFELAIEQTLQLCQQFLDDETVQRIAGNLGAPWEFTSADIQGKYEVSATIDVRMWDEDYANKKLQMMGQAMTFNQAGNVDMSGMMKLALEMIDPDAADVIVQSDEIAADRETQDEEAAIAKILTGIDAKLPQFGNFQLRLQTLLQATLQSQNPLMMQRLQAAPDSQEMLKNRAEYFTNQIQQYQKNPQIGRSLATSTFNPREPAAMTKRAYASGVS